MKPLWQIYYEELQSGMSYAEVAEKHGVSKQNIYQAVGKHKPTVFREITNKQCIYPNLRAWINDNKITRAEFSRRMWGNSYPGGSRRIKEYFSGKCDPPKKTIDRMIEVTGLPYEILFKKGGAENGGKQ